MPPSWVLYERRIQKPYAVTSVRTLQQVAEGFPLDITHQTPSSLWPNPTQQTLAREKTTEDTLKINSTVG